MLVAASAPSQAYVLQGVVSMSLGERMGWLSKEVYEPTPKWVCSNAFIRVRTPPKSIGFGVAPVNTHRNAGQRQSLDPPATVILYHSSSTPSPLPSPCPSAAARPQRQRAACLKTTVWRFLRKRLPVAVYWLPPSPQHPGPA